MDTSGIIIISGLLLIFVSCIISIIYFKKSKQEENKIIFQTIPMTFFLLLAIILSESPLASVSEGYAIGFGFLIPGALIAILFQVIIGIMGIVKATNENPKQTLLLISSIISVSSIFSMPLVIFLFPLAFIVLIIKKGIAKAKE